MVGDVVMWREEGAIHPTYKPARVHSGEVGDDGRVRRAVLEYKNRGEDGAGFRYTDRSVHSLVVIVPADWSEEDVEQAVCDGVRWDR